MRRVVITGMGIVSSIGNNTQEVLASLHEAKSGITRADKYAELGFRCQVQGAPTPRSGRASSTGARCASSARARRGITSRWSRRSRIPGSQPAEVSNVRTGIIMGSGGPSARTIVEAADITRTKGPKRVGPFAVPKAMSSTASATLRHLVQDQGRELFDLVGLRDLEPLHRQRLRDRSRSASRTLSSPAAARNSTGRCRCCSTRWARCRRNTTTRRRRRRAPYDVSRDGFVIAGGAGVVVLEELEHAKARGARIYARNRRLRRDLGRLRHGRALGRRRGALHEDGAGDREDARSTTSIRTRPRRRPAIRRKSKRSARCSAPATSARRFPRPRR